MAGHRHRHRPKKRRISELIASSSPPPPATDAPAPDPRSPVAEELRWGQRRRRSRAGAGGGVDRLSDLPVDIVGDIVSLLPTKEAARTQLLSRHFSQIWARAPLNLDNLELPDDDEAFCSAVSRILATHNGPGRVFRVPAHLLHDHGDAMAGWFDSPALDKLQEMHLCSVHHGRSGPNLLQRSPVPPASAFRCSSTLRVINLSICSVPDGMAQTLSFPKLQKLALMEVNISEGSLHGLMAASPVLDCLMLSNCFGFRRVRINSATLRDMAVSASYNYEGMGVICFQEHIIEHAPVLRSFIFLDENATDLKVSVISAPGLETLGLHCNYKTCSSRFMFGDMVIQGVDVITSTVGISTVKTLSVHLDAVSLDTVIDLMRCFPSLENLYIQCYRPGGTNRWRSKYRNLLKSLDMRLKTVFLRIFRGTWSEVRFATFFIFNAKMMERMVFHGVPCSDREAFSEKLELEKRASRGAQFYFKEGHRVEFPYVTYERCP
ncbi:hypothetical protein ACP4OV_007078 [Aristida adscensionis]